jgi:VWFA-related protein
VLCLKEALVVKGFLSKSFFLAVACVSIPAFSAAQNTASDDQSGSTTLHLTSRAVVLDVVVTDQHGKPVTGLQKDVFSVSEEGKPQSVSFFEEHNGASPAQARPLEFPALPQNVFTNFSPLPTPPAVNILLLDTLNTQLSDQMYVRQAAKKYLQTLKPGSRIAIFTLSMRLSFVQGFADDPAVLAAALGLSKYHNLESSPLLSSPGEQGAQGTLVNQMSDTVNAGPGGLVSAASPAMIAAMQAFMQETQNAQLADREYRTLAALQDLAAYLGGFPGRKNLIWLSGSFPLNFFGITGSNFSGASTNTDARFDDEIKKTVDLLTVARVAVYPVNAQGNATQAFYGAENNPAKQGTVASQGIGFSGNIAKEDKARDQSHLIMDQLAEETGGKAFKDTNDLAGVINNVVSTSGDFYSLSYTPTNENMNGAFRDIKVKLSGGNYTLSYRRGYFADDLDLPGSGQSTRYMTEGGKKNAAPPPPPSGPVDPLKPFMDLGMPQTEQILYKAFIQPLPANAPQSANPPPPSLKGPLTRYGVNFAIDANDLALKADADGVRRGKVNVSLIVYDKYGQIITRKDYLVPLAIKPETYKGFQQTGVQLYSEVDVPKGQYWLRTGVFDQATRKVGTMELSLNAVHAPDLAAK